LTSTVAIIGTQRVGLAQRNSTSQDRSDESKWTLWTVHLVPVLDIGSIGRRMRWDGIVAPIALITASRGV